MKANSYLQIDLQAIKHNIHHIQEEIGPEKKLIPVLKGNAYGLGAVRLARFCSQVEGIDTFAVSHVSEGVQLRQAGIGGEILVMSLPLDFQIPDAVEHNLTLTLGSFRQFPLLREAACTAGKKISVSLKADTGLHRIGFLPEETDELCREISRAEDYLHISGTFSHFSSEEKGQMEKQAKCFDSFLDKLRSSGIDPGLCHISSSASLEADRKYVYDAVRIGRGLMLDNPVFPSGEICEAVSFRAYLTDIRNRKTGDTLAYGGKTVLKKDTTVGVLSIGYGDGLDPALVSAHAPVLVNGKRACLLAACMDQSFVELDGIDAGSGDEVTLFGYDAKGNHLPAQEVAALIDCEGCDLTVRLTDRVERIFLS